MCSSGILYPTMKIIHYNNYIEPSLDQILPSGIVCVCWEITVPMLNFHLKLLVGFWNTDKGPRSRKMLKLLVFHVTT